MHIYVRVNHCWSEKRVVYMEITGGIIHTRLYVIAVLYFIHGKLDKIVLQSHAPDYWIR